MTDVFSPRHSTNPVEFALCTQLIENVGASGDGIGGETIEIDEDVAAVRFYHGAEVVEWGLPEFPAMFDPQ